MDRSYFEHNTPAYKERLNIRVGRNELFMQGELILDQGHSIELEDEETGLLYEFEYDQELGILYVTAGPVGKKCIRCSGTGREPNP